MLYQNLKVSFPLSLPIIQFFFCSKAKSDLSEAVIGDYLLTARYSWAFLVNPILFAIYSESEQGKEERGLEMWFLRSFFLWGVIMSKSSGDCGENGNWTSAKRWETVGAENDFMPPHKCAFLWRDRRDPRSCSLVWKSRSTCGRAFTVL